MSDLVPSDQIEKIVGVQRHQTRHYARAVSAEQMIYILHSRDCLDSGLDLRDCEFSLALDNGIGALTGCQDRPVFVAVEDDELVPVQEDA